MGLSAGPGSPVFFRCTVARRRRERRGHDVTLTGRVKPYKAGSYSAMGTRSTSTAREYRCTCGYVGWSNHVDLERLANNGG
jgi:hypothetical protein